MTYLNVRHNVKNFGTWKTAFESDAGRRRAEGSKSAQLFHDSEHPNSVSVLMEFETADKARKFANDPALKEAMERAGVLGNPEITYLDLVQRLDN
jgi:uncharacterized protein (DUF1330 family)